MIKDAVFQENPATFDAQIEEKEVTHPAEFDATYGGEGAGENGATFTPSVSEDGVLSWTNDKGLENPEPVNIKGKDGDNGLSIYRLRNYAIVNGTVGETEVIFMASDFVETTGEDAGRIGTLLIIAGYLYKITYIITDNFMFKAEYVMDLKGDPGADYVLTDDDKSEIAKAAASELHLSASVNDGVLHVGVATADAKPAPH